MASRRLKRAWREVVSRTYHRLVYTARTDPVIVLGNQKAGTSAIASLLADCAGLSKTIDVPEVWRIAPEVYRGKADFARLVARYPRPFSSELIKEPNLTFFQDDVRRVFPGARYVFVVRDPRTNVRSFISRCNLPGDLEDIDLDTYNVPAAWRQVFDPAPWASAYTHYVDIVAERWDRAAEVHLRHKDEMALVRYEDFLSDKVGVIAQLSRTLGLEPRHDISAKVGIQYQRAGSQTPPRAFFGEANLARIERICGANMVRYGYEPELDRTIAEEPRRR